MAKAAAKQTRSTKDIVIASLSILVIGGVALWLMYSQGLFGHAEPKVNPDYVDPTSTLLPEEKKQLEQNQKEQERMQESPESPPPAGA